MKNSKLFSKILKALANEKRLKILKLLLDNGEYNVMEISEELKMPFRTISRHLERLRSADLVEFRQQGLQNYYSIPDLDQTMIKDLLKFIQKYYRN